MHALSIKQLNKRQLAGAGLTKKKKKNQVLVSSCTIAKHNFEITLKKKKTSNDKTSTLW